MEEAARVPTAQGKQKNGPQKFPVRESTVIFGNFAKIQGKHKRILYAIVNYKDQGYCNFF